MKQPKKNKIWVIVGVAAFVAALAFLFVYGALSRESELEQQVRLAKEDGCLPLVLLSSMTGSYQYVGTDAAWTAQYAVDQINRTGGINGTPVRLIVADTGSSPDSAQRLLGEVQSQLLCVLGPVNAPETAAVAEDVAQYGLLDIGTYSFQGALEQAAPYGAAYMSQSVKGEMAGVTAWAACNPDIHSIVIFSDQADSSKQESAEALQEYLPQLGIEVLEVVDVPADSDQRLYMQAAIQALNRKPDGYLSLLSGPEYTKILFQLRQRGVEDGRRIISSFSGFTQDMIDLAGDNLDGTYIWSKFNPYEESSQWAELSLVYQEEHGGAIPLNTIVVDLYDAIMALKQCCEELNITGNGNNQTVQREQVAQWFYNSPEVQGIQSTFYWKDGEKIKDYVLFVFEEDTPVKQEK